MIEMTADTPLYDFLRTDNSNAFVVAQLLDTAVSYVTFGVGAENAFTSDARCVSAVWFKTYDMFYAETTFELAITALICQIRADPYIPPVAGS